MPTTSRPALLAAGAFMLALIASATALPSTALADEPRRRFDAPRVATPTAEVSQTADRAQPWPPGGAAVSDPRQRPVDNGELLVRYAAASARSPQAFGSSAARRDRARLNAAVGTVAVGQLPETRTEVVRLEPGVSASAALRRYRRDPAVELAEPNHSYFLLADPDDPLFAQQWSLVNTGQTGGTPDADIDADEAWAAAGTDQPVVVVVLDTGIDTDHPDLSGRLWTNPGEVPGDGVDNDGNGYVDDLHGWDVVDNDGAPTDLNGHGTHVAGTIAAASGNGRGIAGVAPDVQVAACRMFDATGVMAADGAIRCLTYVKALRDAGVPVVATNNSWGGGAESLLLRQAIDSMPDVLFVASAGNSAADHDVVDVFPASYPSPHVISVSATDHDDRMPYWSDRGGATVSLAAPGVDIVSLRAAGTTLGGPEALVPPGDESSEYVRVSGTSMATPHVTGVVALVKQHDATLDARAIKNLVLAGADAVPRLEDQTTTGRRLNAAGAIACDHQEVLAAVGRPPDFPLAPGAPVTLSVLSIDCASPIGPVLARSSRGERFELLDDGVAPDLSAGDGIFSATWTPTEQTGWVRFTSGTGTLVLPRLAVHGYLPEAHVGVPYRRQLTAAGATGPVTWSIRTGSLPDGLTLGFDGVVTGTPTAAGGSPFRVRGVDANGQVAGAELVVRVADDDVVETVLATDVDARTVFPLDHVVDGAGNTLVTGYYLDPDSGRQDVFLSKFDPRGERLWIHYARHTQAWTHNWGWCLAVDATGAAYVGSGNPSFSGESDLVVTKYDADGQQVWATNYSADKREVPLGLAVGPDGNIVAAGLAWGPRLADPTEALTVKLDPEGQVLWDRRFTAAGVDVATDVGVDAAGDVYVSGRSGAPLPGGALSYVASVLKYSSSGELVWSRSSQGSFPTLETGEAVAVAADGTHYVGLSWGYQVQAYAADGSALWSQGLTYADRPVLVEDLELDRNGDLALAGTYFDDTRGAWTYLVGTMTRSGRLESLRPVSASVYRQNAVDVSVTAANVQQASIPHDGGLVLTSFRRALRLRTTRLPTPVRGVPYAQRLELTGGGPVYRWRVVGGALPAGLRLGARTGVVSGTPTKGGRPYDVTVGVTDGSGLTVGRRFRGRVGFVKVDAMFTRASWTAGDSAELTFTAQGTARPFTWRISEGSLPPGLRLRRRTGVVTGVPETAGSYAFSVQVIDAQGHRSRRMHTWEVVEVFRIVTATLPDATVGVPYTATVETRGGTPPFVWAIFHDLPPGLDIDSETGVISGVPTEAGTYPVGVSVTADGGASASSRDLPLTVLPG